MEKPISAYECIPIKENDGWCDDVYSDNYNTIITLPSAESYENLWRHDELYDIIIVLGYNDNPVVKGAGSAIFIHIAKDGMQHTKGCLALQKNDLLLLISKIDTKTSISIN
jgi:L,D-peptidoglycan transpeptidase YkuD (ErfK/YbiS/YcfS/YnhG family)